MSSIPLTKANQNKENALRPKSQDVHNEKTLARHTSKTVLRTKSSNSIVKPQDFGNYNKIRKTSTLGDVDLFEPQENVKTGARKFKVQRDSPLSNTKHKLPLKHEPELDDEIEIVPAKEDELPYIPDNLEPLPEDLLEDTLKGKTRSKNAKSLNDPLELDLSYLQDMEQQDAETTEKPLELVLEFPEEGQETESKKLDHILQDMELHSHYKPKRL
ncbi:hypothetical protein OGAPHI_000385 [Ogataea philodendri]|uniref:Securin n=1 Tax=Ogataea philodendri TaxID=1378263 RepID=A0A9P8PHM5_9ASCO|nr:uncharacterized protein OGAPHI_000385 [Ogataea philodendri]KAH3671680.1 hypothetical protein OGAPHI_000385 [Ogataea philodendri]